MDDLFSSVGTGWGNTTASGGEEIGSVRKFSPEKALLGVCVPRAEVEVSRLEVTYFEQRISRLEDLLGTMAQRYTIEVTKEHGEWFAEDVDLGVSGNGETRAEAVSQLAEAIAHETGELEFSDEFRSELETATQQIEAGETHSAADVRDRLGTDD